MTKRRSNPTAGSHRVGGGSLSRPLSTPPSTSPARPLAGRLAVAASLALAVLLAPGPAGADEVAPVPSAPAAASQGPEFLARVDHEVVRRQANGVTRIERWQETMARAGRTVWIERILPARASLAGHEGHAAKGDHDRSGDHGHAGDHDHPGDRHHSDDHDHSNDRSDASHAHHDQAIRGHGHRHFDGDAAARWIEQADDGKVTLALVDRNDRAIVSIPRAEFRTMGFDGRFEGSASLVPAAVIATMSPDPTATPATTPVAARWLLDRSDGWTHRVLWSDALQLALQIDSRRDDGSLTRSVRVELAAPVAGASVALALPQAWPWQELAGYERRRYDEYLD